MGNKLNNFILASNNPHFVHSFLVGDNGVYEGTGWHVRGAHTSNFNSNATGIAFIGDFSGGLFFIYFLDIEQMNFFQYFSSESTEELPSEVAIESAKALLQCGVKLGEIDQNYILLRARQIIATESPGLELYGIIQDWDHWQERP